MKKIPQPDKSVPKAGASTDSDEHSLAADEPLPVMPGTEETRSLGDLMRDAEAATRLQSETAGAHDVTRSSVDSANAEGSGGATRPRRSKKPSRAQSRRFARERALQALYQWDVSSSQSSTVRKEFLDSQDMSRVDVDYFVLLFNGVSHDPQTVDDILADCLDRPINELDPIERAVLRITAFELSQQLDIPARVVINEGIEITKRFGADKGHRYVNGVLDKLALTLRPLEMKAR